MAQSPLVCANAGIVWVSAPGDYAILNSNQTPDGTERDGRSFSRGHRLRRGSLSSAAVVPPSTENPSDSPIELAAPIMSGVSWGRRELLNVISAGAAAGFVAFSAAGLPVMKFAP